MFVDLVKVTTSDGVRLDGALQAPPSAAGTVKLPVDAALLVHGTGGSFYSATMFETIAASLLESGLAVLSINTRGHDLVSTANTSFGPRRQGAAYEDVSQCRLDLAAWADWLIGRGFPRVALVGHSLGAVKAIYSQAHQPHPAFQQLIAISPPRLSCSHFLAGPKAAEFQSLLTAAEALVAAGRGDELMDVRFPLPYLVTASGYLDKYGPEERYSVLPLIERLTTPTLLTFGSQEVQTNAAFSGLPEAIEAVSQLRSNIQVATIAGADHFYSGCRSELASRVVGWMRKQ